MDTFLINKIEKKLCQTRFQSQLTLKKELQKLYEDFPVLLSLENEKRAIVSDFKILKEEKTNKLNDIEKKIKTFITDNGISIPRLSYNCDICNDTGYIKRNDKKERCSCFTKMLINEAMQDENLSALYKFDDFNDRIFDHSIKKQILEIRDYLKSYANKFPDVKKPNIVLHGNTGTGKTFLLSCLYAELKKKGMSVVFITAGKLFDYLRKYALNQISDIDVLLETDLLIIDDMGTEPLFNNITIEYMFLLINERTRNKKPLCISTNLSPDEIKERYSERITSRILDIGITNTIFVPGNDLRLRL